MEVDHEEIDRVCTMIEEMVTAYDIPDFLEPDYPVILDLLDHYGYPDADECKLACIIKLARDMALYDAVVDGLYSRHTQHLYYDVDEPTKFIGFNERVINEGIRPLMVITLNAIISAIHTVDW